MDLYKISANRIQGSLLSEAGSHQGQTRGQESTRRDHAKQGQCPAAQWLWYAKRALGCLWRTIELVAMHGIVNNAQRCLLCKRRFVVYYTPTSQMGLQDSPRPMQRRSSWSIIGSTVALSHTPTTMSTYRVAGGGINVQYACCSTYIFKCGNSLLEELQAIFRVRRPGQTQSQTTISVFVKGAINEKQEFNLVQKHVSSHSFLIYLCILSF